jgi:hypothetical protein
MGFVFTANERPGLGIFQVAFGRSVAVIPAAIISAAPVITTMMVVMVTVSDGISNQAGGSGTRYGDDGIDGLHRAAIRVVGGHAADAGPQASDQDGGSK